MTDWFLENPERLGGQPKRIIGDYVEGQGSVLVPQRFASARDAEHSGLSVMARSEHPQDYDGVSGLLDSKRFDARAEIPEEKELLDSLLENNKFTSIYAGIIGRPELLDSFSLSFWEFIPGYNRVVVADSSVPNRHHITTTHHHKLPEGYQKCHNYTLMEDGEILIDAAMPLPAELAERLPHLIETYERIRHMDRFDPNHCPLMEFQSTLDSDYFLQYFRTRNFQAATFELDHAENGDYPVLFTRGITPPDGLELDVTILHAHNHSKKKWGGGYDWPLPEKEDGALDVHYNCAYVKAILHRRQLQLIGSNNRDWELMKLAVGHEMREVMYLPPVSLIVDKETLCGANEDRLRKLCNETGEDAKMRLHVVADGRHAVLNNAEI